MTIEMFEGDLGLRRLVGSSMACCLPTRCGSKGEVKNHHERDRPKQILRETRALGTELASCQALVASTDNILFSS